MKVYQYPLCQLLVSSVGPVILMGGLMGWAVQNWLQDNTDLIYRLIIVVIPLILSLTFVGLHQPTQVIVDNETIRFRAFGCEHVYYWSEVRSLSLVKFFLGERYYVQIGEPGFFHGRYWIGAQIDGYRELITLLQAREKELKVDYHRRVKTGVYRSR